MSEEKQLTPEHRIRCGDIVRSKRTGEELLVAYADYDTSDLSWYGWPPGRGAIGDFDLVKACGDDVHEFRVAQWLDPPHHSEDHRHDVVRRLYRPDEHRRLIRDGRAKRIAELETELSRLRQERDNDR